MEPVGRGWIPQFCGWLPCLGRHPRPILPLRGGGAADTGFLVSWHKSDDLVHTGLTCSRLWERKFLSAPLFKVAYSVCLRAVSLRCIVIPLCLSHRFFFFLFPWGGIPTVDDPKAIWMITWVIHACMHSLAGFPVKSSEALCCYHVPQDRFTLELQKGWMPVCLSFDWLYVLCPASCFPQNLLTPLLLWTHPSSRVSPWGILQNPWFRSFAQSRPALCDPMDCSMPGFPVHHHLLELAQTPVHRAGDAIQPSHPLSSPSPAFSLAQHQALFQWVSSSHQVAKVLEFQLQHQSFQRIFTTDFL